MSLAAISRQVGRFVRSNSPEILTAIGVIGTITTAVLAGRVHHEAMQELEHEEIEHYHSSETANPLTNREKFKHVWKYYVPPVVSGVVTIGAIVGVNRIGTRRTVALAAAYSILENSFDEYREKVTEIWGENKQRAVRDEIAQDRIDRSPASQQEIIVAGGSVLCYDGYTDRYFLSSVEKIRQAENDVNFQILHGGYASLGDFYLSLGLYAPVVSEAVGWNIERLLVINLSTCLSDDQRPCISIEFERPPDPAYQRTT